MSTYALDTDGRVPFAPISSESAPMRFRADDDWTFDGTPLRVAWEQAYRDAAHRLLFGGDEDEARRLARFGRDLEDAYVARVGAEYRAREASRSEVSA